MKLSDYFSIHEGTVSFTEQQASAFAKGIAGDFNPLHDPGNRRFCVPGDLLFCVLLGQYGVAQSTAVQFSGMLDGSTRMKLPDEAAGHTHILDVNNKALLSLSLEQTRYTNPAFISGLSEQYVQFSGQTFPDILVPLMRDANVMINPDRPMVIYKDMSININADAATLVNNFTADDDMQLQLADTDISVAGKKAAVRLQFAISTANQPIGTGEKNMLLSGLREFDDAAMRQIVDQYNIWRSSYQGGN